MFIVSVKNSAPLCERMLRSPIAAAMTGLPLTSVGQEQLNMSVCVPVCVGLCLPCTYLTAKQT